MKDEPAFPQEEKSFVFEKGHENCARKLLSGINRGLTKREYFIGQALANPQVMTLLGFSETDCEAIGRRVCKIADAVLRESERSKEEK